MATSASKKTAKGASKPTTEAPMPGAASKDIWLAGLGAMAQAQAQARAQGSKAFESLVEKGLAFQRQSQASAQEKINEAAAHFNQLTQGLGAGLVTPVGAKVDRLEHLFEDRVMKIGLVDLGAQVTVGARSTILYDTTIGDRVRLGPLTLVAKGERLPPATHWTGSPASPAP